MIVAQNTDATAENKQKKLNQTKNSGKSSAVQYKMTAHTSEINWFKMNRA